MINERVRIRVYGNSNFIVNLLIKHSIKGIRPSYKENALEFSVDIKEYLKLKALLNDYGKKYQEISHYGGLINFKKLAKRYTYFIGVLIGVVAVYFYSTLIKDISIQGTNNIDQGVVRTVVQDCLKLPTFNANLDTDKIEDSIVQLDGISYAKVYKRGCTLFVEVVEELPKIEIMDTQNLGCIVAREDGEIVKIVIYGGSTTLKAGDKVKAGDVLIYPYISSADGINKPTPALGEVYAKITRVEELTFASQEEYDLKGEKEIALRVASFKDSLKEGEQFIASRISQKTMDKSIVCSIYYELVTRIA